MKKVFGYIRVSTLKQGEGVSLEAQKEAISRYAQKHDLEVVQWFEEKETAAKQGRPMFSEIVKRLRKREVSGVIIHKVDRSARNLRDWADLGELIDDGIEVHFAHESLDLKARGGRLSADIQAIIAADYVRNLREEAIKGLYGRLKQGIYPWQAPLGYLDTGGGKPKTIDPIKGPLVKKAFELYASGQYCLRTLLPALTKMGLTNIRNKPLHLNSLNLIMRNPYYIGLIKVKDQTFNGTHEPLISARLFKTVQDIMDGKRNTKITKHFFLFRRMIKCEKCQFTLVGERQKGHVYYRCHTRECPVTALREEMVNRFLGNGLEALQLTDAEVSGLHEKLRLAEDDWGTTKEELEKSYNLQIGSLEQRLDRLTDAYVDMALDKDAFESRKARILTQLRELKDRRSQLTDGKHEIFERLSKFLELSKSLKTSYETGTDDEKRELLEIVASNLVTKGKNLMIALRNPFDLLFQRNLVLSIPHCKDTSRKMSGRIAAPANVLIYSDPNTSGIVTKQLTKEQLCLLFDELMKAVENWQSPDQIDDRGG